MEFPCFGCNTSDYLITDDTIIDFHCIFIYYKNMEKIFKAI